MKKSTLVILILILLLVVFGVYSYSKNQPNQIPDSGIATSTGNIDSIGATTTLQGVFTCLKHKNSDGPQTMECAYGIKTDNGLYYALDWSGTPNSAFDLPMNQPYSVTGYLVPIEAISNDHWRIYDIRGIMKVYTYKEISETVRVEALNKSIVLELKKPVSVQGEIIRVQAVTEDSRCASDVQCIQAGKVRALFEVNSDSGQLSQQLEPGNYMETNNLKISLSKVTPYPVSTQKITDTDYRFEIVVTKK